MSEEREFRKKRGVVRVSAEPHENIVTIITVTIRTPIITTTTSIITTSITTTTSISTTTISIRTTTGITSSVITMSVGTMSLSNYWPLTLQWVPLNVSPVMLLFCCNLFRHVDSYLYFTDEGCEI